MSSWQPWACPYWSVSTHALSSPLLQFFAPNIDLSYMVGKRLTCLLVLVKGLCVLNQQAMTNLRATHVVSVTQYEEEVSHFSLGVCSLRAKDFKSIPSSSTFVLLHFISSGGGPSYPVSASCLSTILYLCHAC